MTDFVAELVAAVGKPVIADPVPDERFEQFKGVFPPALLDYWRAFGLGGFAKGRRWLCDPVAWKPAVDAWTAHLDLAMGHDNWWAISRTAFGDIQLWGSGSGRV